MQSRYADPDVDLVFSPGMRLANRTRIWAAAAQALQDDDPERDCAFDLTQLDLPRLIDRAGELEARYGHDVAAQCEALREQLTGGAARWLHFGLCSSDIADADQVQAIRAATHLLLRQADQLRLALLADHDFDWMTRTHGQATGIARAFSEQTAVWAGRVFAGQAGLNRANRVWPGGFQGPVGKGAAFGPRVTARVCEALGLAPAEQDQASDRSRITEWLQAAARLVGAAEHFALQVRLGAQTGIEEFREPPGVNAYRGSSSMPAKTNPTRSERICGLATVARALVNAHAEATSAWSGNHSLEHSSVERMVIPQVAGLAMFILREATEIAEGLQVDVARCRQYAAAAPADSYAERNRLIAEGVDGGVAWEQARA